MCDLEDEEMELFPAAMFAFDDDQWEELAQLKRPTSVRRSRGSGEMSPGVEVDGGLGLTPCR